MSETQQPTGGFFDPASAVEGANVDFKGTIVASRAGRFTYKGTDGEQTAHQVVIRNDDDPTARLRTEDWSIGKVSYVTPTNEPATAKDRQATETGNFIMRTKGGEPLTGLPKGSISNQVIEKMLAGGMPKSELNGPGFDIFVGLQLQFGLGKTKLASGKEAEKSRLLPTGYHGRVKVDTSVDYFALALQQREAVKAGQPQEASGTTTPEAVASASAAVTVDEEFVTNLVLEVLGEAGGTIKKSDLSSKVMAKIGDTKTRTAAVKILLSEKYLKAIEGVSYDGKELKIA
jgi:hypothetical protein